MNYNTVLSEFVSYICPDCTLCLFQGHFEYNFTTPGDYDVEVTAIAYFNAGTNLSSQCYCRTCKYHMNLAEPNSTLEQTSLNAVGRDIGPELGLREVKMECQLD